MSDAGDGAGYDDADTDGDGSDGADTDGADASASTPTIRELDDRTVRQIAAGEVVERPASVVKELVENSLDAGADRISVAVEAGGTDGIRVRDDGVGMDREAVERAVEEHTTSKIQSIDDLEAGVGTLGFRGEALHTISAVSRLTIRTKPRGGDSGTELRVEGGEVTHVGAAGCPAGSVVAVEDLFYNTPARRKFLKTTATEFDHVNTVVTHYALANPDVAISLEHDDREVFATEGRGDLQSAVLSVYGREVAEAMIRVDHQSDSGGEGGGSDAEPGSGAAAASPVASVAGLVSHPETTRSTREYLSTFVNGRYVAAGVLREAVLDAYGGQLASDRYPFAVLFVDLPADSVDVNVHPRKMEVRYNKPDAVKNSVRTAIENALREEGILRSSAPRGRSAPEQTPIEPVTPDDEVELTPDHPTRSTKDATDGPASNDTDERLSDTQSARQFGDTNSTAPQPDTQPPQSTDPSHSPTESSRTSESKLEGTDSELASSDPETQSQSAVESEPEQATNKHPPQTISTTNPETQTTLHGDVATSPTEYDDLPNLRVLGQLQNTYIVAETDDGLVLIDQHAADERVNYERLQKQFEGDTTAQALAEPVEVELTAREASAFAAARTALSSFGFQTERVDDRTIEVSTVPAVIAEPAGPELVRDVIVDLVDDESDPERMVEEIADELLADMACHPSITGNTSLTEGSVVELLSALDDCDNPWSCPHGRPVVIQIDSDEIDERFERDYPGH